MIQPIGKHRCSPSLPLRVKQVQRQGYFEAYHEPERALAQARAVVAERAGFQTLIEEAADGYLVLVKSTHAAPLVKAA